ncbi:hypothetical protein RQM59_11145 [Flavobacteriaceae bacterium S356]|uniref:Uncharacterized protein n=2 Tax=Asprobacillus argus TaxID=3076534 RepID=A0ABU3LGT1_9FLAO|nr:hypothetical protein [Flavobacteriaceae bacterium S356]
MKNMFKRNYTVKGEDVNDFMVMQNFAYLKYTSKLIELFLLEKGFSKPKLNDLKIGWQKNNDQLKNSKKLMFMESFSAVLEFDTSAISGNRTHTIVRFFNEKKEVCSTVVTELHWVNYNNWEIIHPPKGIMKYFSNEMQHRRAS